eukprot:gene7198-9823_t
MLSLCSSFTQITSSIISNNKFSLAKKIGFNYFSTTQIFTMYRKQWRCSYSTLLSISLSNNAYSKSSFHMLMDPLHMSTKTGAYIEIEPVTTVRNIMEQNNLDAIVIPTDDPHMSEYTALYFNRREFISKFTGSAGTAIITRNSSLLFTDGRYHNQAEKELPSDWILMKSGLKDVPTPSEYLYNTLPHGATVGIDPLVHSAESIKKIEKNFESKNIKVRSMLVNPIDAVWTNRPPKPDGMVRIHPIEYAGKSVHEKMNEIRVIMKEKKAHSLVITALDEIAWLFNIRGRDVPCNPVAVCYAVLQQDAAYLFIDDNKVSSDIKDVLLNDNVHIRSYEDIQNFVKNAANQNEKEEFNKIWFDGKTVNLALYNAVKDSIRFEATSPIIIMKACKNSMELLGMKSCHLRDGAAMVEFFSWLEEHLISKTLTEVEIDHKVNEFRASFGMFLEPSFPTIAGVNENGAIIHYRAAEGTCKVLTNNDMLLLDSGGQYHDGTTDVTRTIHTGTPSDYQKEMFTRVLKGHIAVDSRVFPSGTPGCLLDSYAREALWAIGKNFIHGTGHGVGAALNVHEGPHRISPVLDSQPLQPGMIVSNEPGYYENNNFGIRIENLLIVVEKPELGSYAGRNFLGFERLTHIPIQKKLLDVSLLTLKEKEWINVYHSEIFNKLSPLLKSDRAKLWLKQATSFI